MNKQYVTALSFEEYKEKFKDFLIIERKNGIISARMHTEGGPVRWGIGRHNALPEAFQVIGNDPDNEVFIITSTGPYWIGLSEPHDPEGMGADHYDLVYYDATKIIENIVYSLDIPTIAAVNGPGHQTGWALMCDITLCTDDVLFQDFHFNLESPPGDGQGLTFQELLGTKRSAYYLYTGDNIDAKTALEWGMVNEIVPREKLMNRAWEIAEKIMKRHRITRRVTSQIVKRPWKRRLQDDFQFHIAAEMYSTQMMKTLNVQRGSHDMIREAWEKRNK